MKTKAFGIFLVTVLLGSCTIPRYVPFTENLGTGTHGSYMTVWLKSGAKVAGELIAADSNNLVLLTSTTKGQPTTLSTLPVISVDRFILQYARPINYAWGFLPAVGLPLIPFPDPDNRQSMMFFHGFYSILTIPLNLTAVGIIYGWSLADFRYTNLTLSYFDLFRFARYPQGLPPGTDLSAIR